jgi:receptor expression-enhancing protein 5/6
LDKIPLAVQFEKQAKVPKAFVAVGTGALLFIMIFFNIMGNLLTNLVGFVYPAYASFKAIESTDKNDDVQWL